MLDTHTFSSSWLSCWSNVLCFLPPSFSSSSSPIHLSNTSLWGVTIPSTLASFTLSRADLLCPWPEYRGRKWNSWQSPWHQKMEYCVKMLSDVYWGGKRMDLMLSFAPTCPTTCKMKVCGWTSEGELHGFIRTMSGTSLPVSVAAEHPDPLWMNFEYPVGD